MAQRIKTRRNRMKDQNEISNIIYSFRLEEEKLGNCKVFIEESELTEHDLLLLNRAFSWLFNIRGIKPFEVK